MKVQPSIVLLTGLLSLGQARSCSGNSTSETVKVHWIGETPGLNRGTTFGLPWPQGSHQPNDTDFTISAADSTDALPLQSWVTGYWRDGSIKWTAHALSETTNPSDEYTVKATKSKHRKRSASNTNNDSSDSGIVVKQSDDQITVNTGKVAVSFPTTGNLLVKSIQSASGKTVAKDGRLVLQSQSNVTDDYTSRGSVPVDYFNFESQVQNVSVSEQTSVRTLVTVRGTHSVTGDGSHDDWFPFVVRFYLYANSDAVRAVHSIVYDGDVEADFISAVGLRFQVPLKDEELYNRHVRMPGVDGGFLREAVQGITGLRRDPGEEVRSAQVEGKETPDLSTWDERVSSRMRWVLSWNDYRLSQLSPDGFTIKKRTEAGQSWVNIPGGTRSGGLAYLGGATQGGLAVGLRDFWQRYPTGLEISNAATDEGSITLWLYSPDAEPLDLRPYHATMGLDTYEDQLDALQITYEDFEPGFDTPFGIARTNEIYLFAFDETPSTDQLASLTKTMNDPPALATTPKRIRDTKAIGTYWGLPDASTTAASEIENHLDFLNKFYQGQIDDRRFYGFLDYGDFMHTYDEDRHSWRYDIGGFAWDNSELSPDLFFWQYFLRTGRADVWRFAEKLTRHTGEVDVYHAGKWKGIGTRHGVQHFSDSAKQGRIAQPQYRKYFYYLSGGDERVGELLEECLDADQTYGVLDAYRKVRDNDYKPTPGGPNEISLGTDWGALAGGWLIEWERRGPRWEEARDKLTGTAGGIAKLTNGFVTGYGLYAIANGTIIPSSRDPDNSGYVSISHLDAVFGLPEVVSESLEYWGDDAPEGFRDAWLDYCYYFGATREEQIARYGEKFSSISLVQGHSRLTAYYAREAGNQTTAVRAWKEFYEGDGMGPDLPWNSTIIDGSEVLIPVEEAAWLSTNAVAQYGLAAIADLEMVGDAQDKYLGSA